jgi:RecA-family ATPase
MTLLERAAAYLDKCPPAVAGNHGHDVTLRTASTLINGFSLSESDARPLMLAYSARCDPPWTDADIDRKLAEAARLGPPPGKTRGWLMGTTNNNGKPRSTHPTGAPAAPKLVPRVKPAPPDGIALPVPVPDATRTLLRACFEPGEGIRVARGRNSEDGREIPENSGIVLSREEWLRRLDESDGNPNAFLNTSDRNGLFCGINPMKPGGAKDADVTAFRHVLIEFDGIPIEEQWRVLVGSNVPASVILHSGGKSIHAWVRVDARDRQEYDLAVRILHEAFADFAPDSANRNPSRFSRLAGAERGQRRQELLATHFGAESWSAWVSDREEAGVGREISLFELLKFQPDNDPNSLLGKRWLCRGGSCLIVGPSGVGKSSLIMQAAVQWALGVPFFGLAPSKPLKSMFIQAENDEGDMAEMIQGVLKGTGYLRGDAEHAEGDAEIGWKLKSHLVFIEDSTSAGASFIDVLQRRVDKYKPDLVWIDPALSFVGDDLSKQVVVKEFFRTGLNKVFRSAGCCGMIVHHTGKPSTDPRARKGWSASDYAYMGTGSSDLTNWARAVLVLRQCHDDVTFELNFAKRGSRNGICDLGGNRVSKVWLKHGSRGICWETSVEPQDAEPKRKAGRKGSTDYPEPTENEEGGRPGLEFDPEEFVATIAGHGWFTYSWIINAIGEFVGCSEPTAKRRWAAVKSHLLYDAKTKQYSVREGGIKTMVSKH